jgi:polyribonucleotide nucleotidyltransferase
MSLMDAGVPIKKPVAGIAMGLMSQSSPKATTGAAAPGAYKILTDLQGPEDHYGDMDFKVAGTRDGVNAIQLDVKIGGLTNQMIVETMAQARIARMHILDFIQTVIPAPRAEISKFAPRVFRLQINPEKIGMVIGPGGKMINGLIAKYGLAAIDIEEDGGVFISGMDSEKAKAALAEITSMTKEYAVGEIVEGEVIKILDFGAIVDLGGGLDGMIHVSELKDGFVKNVTDVVKLGDFVRAKITRVEDGRIGLSMKALGDQQGKA